MIEGIVRESLTKQATKKLRREGYLIASIYGAGVEKNVECAFKANEFIRYMRNKPSLKFPVKIAGNEYMVVVKEYQKDPITNDLVHADLMAVKDGVSARFLVPVKTIGTPVGLKNKGVLIYSKRRLDVKCDPAILPDSFTLDVSKLDVGDTILVRDIEVPAGVAMRLDGRVPVVGVIKAK